MRALANDLPLGAQGRAGATERGLEGPVHNQAERLRDVRRRWRVVRVAGMAGAVKERQRGWEEPVFGNEGRKSSAIPFSSAECGVCCMRVARRGDSTAQATASEEKEGEGSEQRRSGGSCVRSERHCTPSRLPCELLDGVRRRQRSPCPERRRAAQDGEVKARGAGSWRN